MKTLETVHKANILSWEMWGILFIVLLGAFLHFTFGFSGGWRPLGVISAVNESVWEHLKLAFWPAFFWTIVEYYFLRLKRKDTQPNFLVAKAVGAWASPIIIGVIFYSYTAFTGDSILAVDLSSFVLAVVIGQFVSYRLWSSLRLPGVMNWLGAGLFIVGSILFAVFTFYPPQVDIFRDPPTGGYGIV